MLETTGTSKEVVDELIDPVAIRFSNAELANRRTGGNAPREPSPSYYSRVAAAAETAMDLLKNVESGIMQRRGAKRGVRFAATGG